MTTKTNKKTKTKLPTCKNCYKVIPKKRRDLGMHFCSDRCGCSYAEQACSDDVWNEKGGWWGLF